MSACSSSARRVDAGLLAAYAFPALALALPLIPAQVLLPAHYAGHTATSLALVGAALVGARIIDILSDPVVGWLTDRLLHRGRGIRLLIALGAAICGLSLYQLFTPGSDSDWPYLLCWSAVLFIGWSTVQIPYTVYSARLSSRPADRLRLNGAREAMGLIGILGASLFIAFWPVPDDATRLRDLAVLTLLLGGTGLFLFLFRIRPPAGRGPQTSPRDWRRLVQLRPVRRLVTAWLANGVANGLPAICFPLYVALVLELPAADKGIFLLAYFLAAVASVPVWIGLSRRVSKHRLWCGAMLAACLAFATVPLLSPGAGTAFLVICLATGFALGADLTLPPAIQADVVDWSFLETGQDQAGMLFSVWSMATKLAFGIAAALSFPLLQFFGISENASSASETGKIALVVIYALVPVVIKLLAVSMVWSFPLSDSDMEDVRQGLEPQP